MSLVPTQVGEAFLQNAGKFKEDYELRRVQYGAIEAIRADTARGGVISGAEVQRLKKSYRVPVSAAVLNKHDATMTPEDSCDPVGEGSTSGKTSLTFAPYGFTIEHIPSIYGENMIGAQQDFAHKMLMGFRTVFDAVDEAALAFLEANKTGIAPTSTQFPVAGGAFNYTGDKRTVYAYLPALLRRMDMSGGGYVSVGDTEHITNLLLTNAHGQYNDVNYAGIQNGQLAYSGNFEHYFDNRLDKGANDNKFYLFEKGTTAVIDYVHPQYRDGQVITPGADYSYTTSDPVFGFQWEAHYKAKCADRRTTYSGLPGQTLVETYWFGLKLSFVTQYTSGDATPIVAVTMNTPAEV